MGTIQLICFSRSKSLAWCSTICVADNTSQRGTHTGKQTQNYGSFISMTKFRKNNCPLLYIHYIFILQSGIRAAYYIWIKFKFSLITPCNLKLYDTFQESISITYSFVRERFFHQQNKGSIYEYDERKGSWKSCPTAKFYFREISGSTSWLRILRTLTKHNQNKSLTICCEWPLENNHIRYGKLLKSIYYS